MRMVVGLGNPGPKYAAHRHNVGFMVVEALAERLDADPWRDKFQARVARAEIGDAQLVLLEPQTYMNESGRSVQAAAAFYKHDPAEVCVLHDELDLPFGQVRIKVGGGHAGHNGLRSIIACLGTPEFVRVRVGIGRPPPGFRGEVASFVLAPFDGTESAQLAELVKQSVGAVVDIARRGLAPAMNARNVRPRPPRPPKPARVEGSGEVAPAGGAPAPPGPAAGPAEAPERAAEPGEAAGSAGERGGGAQ
jgi:PTH1 family peptidyl-tRNA hydrolase